MHAIQKTFIAGLSIAACLLPTQSDAEMSNSEELGFQAGAMEYCRDNFPADQKTKKEYDALRSSQIQALQNLPGEDKQRALEVAAIVGKSGNAGGKKLSAGRCDQLRKSTLLKQVQGR